MTDWTDDLDGLRSRVTDFSRPARFGGMALAAFMAAFGIWALVVPISGATMAAGTVIADGHTQVLRHAQGGVLSEIRVTEGERVKAGDVIAVLSPEAQRASRGQLLARMASDDVAIARLEAELAGQDFPADLGTRFARYPTDLLDQLIADQAESFTKRAAYRQSQQQVMAAQAAALTQQKIGLEGEIDALRQQIASIEDDMALRQAAQAKGFGRAADLRQIEREHARLTGSLARSSGELNALIQQMAEVDSKKAAFDNDQAQTMSEDLSKLRAEQKELTDQLAAAEMAVSRVEIRADAAGIVNKLDVNTIGSAVEPFAPIAEIVPQDGQVEVEARLAPIDIDNVSIGQDADVTFPSITRHNEPPLPATVTFVSADSQLDQHTGERYFVVRLNLDTAALAEQPPTSPGMIADVYIRQPDHTLVQYLLQPLTQSLTRSFR